MLPVAHRKKESRTEGPADILRITGPDRDDLELRPGDTILVEYGPRTDRHAHEIRGVIDRIVSVEFHRLPDGKNTRIELSTGWEFWSRGREVVSASGRKAGLVGDIRHLFD